MKIVSLLSLVMLAIVDVSQVHAAPLKIYVAEITAIGAPNRGETQATIQTLLASRLNKGTVTTVASAVEADAVVTGSYIVAGKIFSLDAVATAGGRTVARAFVEGDPDGGLIPAINKLAEKLGDGLTKTAPVVSPPAASVPDVASAPSGDIVRNSDKTQGNLSSWRSQPLPGALNLVAAGPLNADGSRDVFLADNHRIYYYRQGSDFRLVSERELKVYEKIISLDVIDSGGGVYELYLTVVANGQPVSRIWQVAGDTIKPVAEGVPYFFRVLTLPGSSKKLYVQKPGVGQLLGGDVFEAVRQGTEITLKNALKLPPNTTLYAFNQFVDAGGKRYTVMFSAENKLVVYDGNFYEVWRSSELYGGSELFVEKQAAAGGTPEEAQIYLNQRIQVTPEGDVLVGKNESLWLLGKKGYYSKGSVYCLAWNGDHLEGKWHTRIADNYMSDYFYDEKARALLQLELVSRPHIFSQGSTALTVRRID